MNKIALTIAAFGLIALTACGDAEEETAATTVTETGTTTTGSTTTPSTTTPSTTETATVVDTGKASG
jgi:hypothetical protein